MMSPFGFDPHIRCCAVFGRDGERIELTHRPGAVSFEPDSDSNLIFKQAALCRDRDQFAGRYHGRVQALLVLSEGLTLIAYPLYEKLVLVTADPGFPLEKTVELGEALDEMYFWLGEPSVPLMGEAAGKMGRRTTDWQR